MTNRRDLLVLAGLAGGAYGLGWWIRRPSFDFKDIPSLPGFRRLDVGQVSGGINIFAGLGDDPPEPLPEIKDVEAALFQDPPVEGTVRVASFSDYNCPYCRILSRELFQLETDGKISVTWHELPLLGPTSEPAARIALAARKQGAYLEAHRQIMAGRFIPNAAFSRKLAADLGLNAEQLISDQRSEDVTRHIQTAKALAAAFALPGTPSVIVGRTLVVGNIPPRTLETLIEIEASRTNY